MKQNLYIILTILLTCVNSTWARSGSWAENVSEPKQQDDVYLISSAEELAWVAQQVNEENNSLKGKSFRQTANIDLIDHNWMPIGKDIDHVFLGNYDGQGYKISGLTVNDDTSSQPSGAWGLFGNVNNSSVICVIENIILDSPNITINVSGYGESTKMQVRAGAIAGFASFKTTIKNCVVDGGRLTVQACANSNNFVGGIVGDVANELNGYTNPSPVVTADLINVAASGFNLSVNGNTNTDGQQNIGGIVGRFRYNHTLPTNSYYSGAITAANCTASPVFGSLRNVNGSNNYASVFKGDEDFVAKNYPTSQYYGNYSINGTTFTSAGTVGDSGVEQGQGVNVGTYTSDVSPLLVSDNTEADDSYQWYKNSSSNLAFVRKPAIELTESDGTLTATTTDVPSADINNLQYHWKKSDAAYDNDASTLTLPLTFEDITWTVWATYMYDGYEFKTNESVYEQKAATKPSLSISDEDGVLTTSFDQDYDLVYTYHWKKGDTDYDNDEATLALPLTFIPITWKVKATYSCDGNVYETDEVSYIQPDNALPTISITRSGDILTANVTNPYPSKITSFTYQWKKDGVNYSTGESVQLHTAMEPITWSVKAYFTYEGHVFEIGPAEYTQNGYSFDLSNAIEMSNDGRTFTITPTLNGSATTAEAIKEAGFRVEYLWLYGNDGADAPTLSLTVERLSNGGEINSPSITTYYTLADNAPVGVKARFYHNKELIKETNLITAISGGSKAKLPKLSSTPAIEIVNNAGTYSVTLSGINDLQPAPLTHYSYTWYSSLGEYGHEPAYSPTGEPATIEHSLSIFVDGKSVLLRDEVSDNNAEYNVVYINATDGDDDNSGREPDKAVKNWARAYTVLQDLIAENGVNAIDHNIIVIVDNAPIQITEAATKGTAATITGVWPWTGVSIDDIKNGGKFKIHATIGSTSYIGADTRFKNLVFDGISNGNATSTAIQSRMSLRLHNAYFDTGLVMQNFDDMQTSYGAISGRRAPNFHIQMSYDFDGTADHQPKPANPYKMSEPMEVVFRSGRYGRVAVSRTQGTANVSNYVQGTPNTPIMAHIIVDILPGNDNTGNPANGQTYADDFGILLGGSSQGLVCADLQFDIKHGTIGTMVAGTQGNNIGTSISNTIPAATFAGRTKVNVGNDGGADDDVTIQSFFGGTQGRAQTSQTKNATSYFYGESEFNMYSGTVKSGVFASATAFSGVGDATNHTPDYAIPYVNGSNELTFGTYKPSGTMATIKSEFQGDVNLSKTTITFNIYGGVIKGGLYGGSKGYEPQIAVGYAPDSAGTHYGDTYVNIYGGSIHGGVHGGGLGTKDYFDAAPTNDGFLKVAQVFGNTHVNIYGGDIQGNIYGGGFGIETNKTKGYEYLPIAKVIGTTSVIIDPVDPNWTFNHNIYGGGSYGAVEGTTNVTILGGIINGNVFGAGKGEDGHPNKAKVTGTTNVKIGKQPATTDPAPQP